MTVIVDYGLGNLFSIKNMFKQIGEEAYISSDIRKIVNSERIILPGVGKFDEGVSNLKKLNLDKVIVEQVKNGKPILGICLGMQLLGNSSEEGRLNGLGLINFETVKFRNIGLKIPHMGWEQIKIEQSESSLLNGVDEKFRFYFVHSYHVVCNNKKNVIVSATYGYEFTAGVQNDNVYGVQFHPEKSRCFGMKLLENFVRLC